MDASIKKYLFFCIIILLVFNACSKPTGYEIRDRYWGSKYGCDDKKISEDEYAIIAKGNQQSTPEHVAQLALYHAAHVALKNSKKYFQIIQKTEKELPNHHLITVPLVFPGIVVFAPVTETSTSEVTSILIIRLEEPAQPPSSNDINAEQVITQLKPVLE